MQLIVLHLVTHCGHGCWRLCKQLAAATPNLLMPVILRWQRWCVLPAAR